MNDIKLVIWDLDETFWEGTLSEGGVKLVPRNVEIVRELTARGIVNSISSKNDYDRVREELVANDLWALFVFPKIGWEPKGSRIAHTLSQAGLRSVNVLFLDDNHSNRKEVSFYNPGIHTLGPESLQTLLERPELQGKKDPEHSRLRQYRHVEERSSELERYADNTDFLRDSKIRVSIHTATCEHLQRVVELVQRTNQLNYTKRRAAETELAADLEDPTLDCRYVRVSDKFGDYGVVGFYALAKDENRLKHFLFSCRILNMGVEAFVYRQLGQPALEVTGDVAVSLSPLSNADWIPADKEHGTLQTRRPARLKILLKGGCDLSQLSSYLRHYDIAVEEEFNPVNTANHPIHREHSILLRQMLEVSRSELEKVARSVPFLDHDDVARSDFFGTHYDVAVYSVLMDYSQDLYQHKRTGVKLPLGGYGALEKLSRDEIERLYGDKGRTGVDSAFLEWFFSEFDSLGAIQPVDFKENLERIVARVSKPVIFINGCEVGFSHPREPHALERHRVMNIALDEFLAQRTDCHLLDMRSLVTSRRQLTNSIRHYQRDIYSTMAQELICLLSSVAQNRVRFRLDSYVGSVLHKTVSRALKVVRGAREIVAR
ncbi:MAG: hypothetical protein CMJ48_01690 [Planctomycetaceae bacterium]|nr:hypothetical protein [Planctomycetaceae bacterium]